MEYSIAMYMEFDYKKLFYSRIANLLFYRAQKLDGKWIESVLNLNNLFTFFSLFYCIVLNFITCNFFANIVRYSEYPIWSTLCLKNRCSFV